MLNAFQTELKKGFMENTTSVVLRSAILTDATVSVAAGTAVKLADYNDGIVVEAITAATDDIYGIIPFTAKKDAFVGKDVVRVVVDNCVIVMQASAAIAVGAKLQVVPASMKVVTQTTGTLVGTALQAAAADGDLIKVELKR